MRNPVALSPTGTRGIPATISAEFLQALRDHGVIQAQLFGSSAVGAAGPSSDMDLLVTFARPVPLFAQLRLADQLQRISGRPVDLMTDLHPAFAPYIVPTLPAVTKSFLPHIQLIRAALGRIQQDQPADEVAFLSRPMVQDAILMRLQEIGENLSRMRHLDDEAFAAAADDSWIQLNGLRNIISHGYHEIKAEQIWQIITEELPAFAASIEAFDDLV